MTLTFRGARRWDVGSAHLRSEVDIVVRAVAVRAGVIRVDHVRVSAAHAGASVTRIGALIKRTVRAGSVTAPRGGVKVFSRASVVEARVMSEVALRVVIEELKVKP